MKNQEKKIYQLELTLQNLFIINPNPKSNYKIRITINYQISERNINKVQNKYSFKLQIGHQNQSISKPYMILLQRKEEEGLYLEIGKGEVDVRQIIIRRQNSVVQNSIIYGTRAYNYDKIVAKFGYVIKKINVEPIYTREKPIKIPIEAKDDKNERLPQIRVNKIQIEKEKQDKNNDHALMKEIIKQKLAEIDDLKKNLAEEEDKKAEKQAQKSKLMLSKSREKRSSMYKIQQISKEKRKSQSKKKKKQGKYIKTSIKNENLPKIKSLQSLEQTSLPDEHYHVQQKTPQLGLAYVYNYSNLVNSLLINNIDDFQSHFQAILLKNIEINLSSKYNFASEYKDRQKSQLLLIKVFTFQKQKSQQKKILQIITPIYYGQINEILKNQKFFLPKNTIGITLYITLASNNSNPLKGTQQFSYAKTKIIELYDRNQEQRGFIFIQINKDVGRVSFNSQSYGKQLEVFKQLMKHFTYPRLNEIKSNSNPTLGQYSIDEDDIDIVEVNKRDNHKVNRLLMKSSQKDHRHSNMNNSTQMGYKINNKKISNSHPLETIYQSKQEMKTPRNVAFRIQNIYFNFYNIFLSKSLTAQFSTQDQQQTLLLNLRNKNIENIPNSLLFTQIPRTDNKIKLKYFSHKTQKNTLKLIGQSQHQKLDYNSQSNKNYKMFVYSANQIIGCCIFQIQMIKDRGDSRKRYKIVPRSHTSNGQEQLFKNNDQQLDLQLTHDQIYLARPNKSILKNKTKRQDYQNTSQLIYQEQIDQMI